jgi:prepilin-type N-terminal cleavage/methylation domain-containing protein
MQGRSFKGSPGVKKRAFTLIELLVVIAIIALLLSVLLPSLRKVKDSARLLVCKTNLRSIHAALNMYANDHHDKISDPRGDTTASPDPRANPSVQWGEYSYDRWCRKWYLRLYHYLETPEVYVCPAWNMREGDSYIAYAVGTETYYVTYTANEYILSSREWEGAGGIRKSRDWKYSELVRLSVGNNPMSLFLADGFYEVNAWGNWKPWQKGGVMGPGGTGRASYRHGGKANFLVANGESGALSMEQVEMWPEKGRFEEFRPSELK